MNKQLATTQDQQNHLEYVLQSYFPSRTEFVALRNELSDTQKRIELLETQNSADEIKKRLSALPSLKNTSPQDRKCKICGSKSPFFDVVDFNKYCGQHLRYISDISGIEVSYFKCESCDFLFTDFCDHWTKEDFKSFIYNNDYIIVDPEYLEIRPAYTADNMAALLAGYENLRIIDYGSGSGGFSKEMIKRGFSQVKNYDPFSSPTLPDGRFNVTCLFEVIEHSPTPIDTLKSILTDILSPSGIIILTQTVQPENIDEIRGSWWYIGPRNGHISTYSEQTFNIICKILDMKYYKLRDGYYVFYPIYSTIEGELLNFVRNTDPSYNV
ncbi:hypothetical protein Geu3261_0185_004 [Komagataeibacter europaeus NBRC 3261]|uniref:Uncharacterized protein n=1 Tax=Komagataeibacter europaeus NBRC 3261 TaxID=1234669 RepID=A0A0D6Q1K5_KOMEU|nr:class I SAM-dependent methyltransferase [Komagataeibacter europaeus]GAN97452.1 hypothetical protein Geu3261_0185_004 [Komagataeibacter europaeus NBRC 3261]